MCDSFSRAAASRPPPGLRDVAGLSSSIDGRRRADCAAAVGEEKVAAEDGDAIGRMSPEATKIWSTLGPNSAVAFDVDLTVTSEDSIDALAKFMGKSDSVAAITDKAMNGDMTLEQALEERMRIINPSPQNVQQYLEATPPSARLNPGAKRLIKALHQRGIAAHAALVRHCEVIIGARRCGARHAMKGLRKA